MSKIVSALLFVGIVCQTASALAQTQIEEQGRGVLITPLPAAAADPSASYSLSVQVKQLVTPDVDSPVSGIVELRPPGNEPALEVGKFFLYPNTEDVTQVHRFKFELSEAADAVKMVNSNYEVEVVSVDALTGLPTAQPNFEVIGAQLTESAKSVK